MQYFDKLLDEFISTYQREKHSNTLSNEELLLEAQLGFAKASDQATWSKDQSEFLSNRIAGSRATDEFDQNGFGGPHVVRFKYYCMGYLLGLYKSGFITDKQFTLAELQLPGFIALHLPKLDSVATR